MTLPSVAQSRMISRLCSRQCCWIAFVRFASVRPPMGDCPESLKVKIREGLRDFGLVPAVAAQA